MILTGASINAEEALQFGLLNRIVPNDDFEGESTRIAEEMALQGPLALRYAKEAIYGGQDMTLPQGIQLEIDLYMLLHTSQDRKEGVKAFREKRKPNFQGK